MAPPRFRPALLLALAGALVVLAFQDALHSAHHLPDPDTASRCTLAASSTSTPATTTDVETLARPALTPLGPVLDAPAPGRGREPLRAASVRAPPPA